MDPGFNSREIWSTQVMFVKYKVNMRSFYRIQPSISGSIIDRTCTSSFVLRCTPLQGQGRSGGSGYLWCRSYCLGFWDVRFSQFHSRPGVQGRISCGFQARMSNSTRRNTCTTAPTWRFRRQHNLAIER